MPDPEWRRRPPCRALRRSPGPGTSASVRARDSPSVVQHGRVRGPRCGRHAGHVLTARSQQAAPAPSAEHLGRIVRFAEPRRRRPQRYPRYLRRYSGPRPRLVKCLLCSGSRTPAVPSLRPEEVALQADRGSPIELLPSSRGSLPRQPAHLCVVCSPAGRESPRRRLVLEGEAGVRGQLRVVVKPTRERVGRRDHKAAPALPSRHLLKPLSERMKQVLGFRICLSAAAERPPSEDSPHTDPRVLLVGLRRSFTDGHLFSSLPPPSAADRTGGRHGRGRRARAGS